MPTENTLEIGLSTNLRVKPRWPRKGITCHVGINKVEAPITDKIRKFASV
jgi:hypothetical protein